MLLLLIQSLLITVPDIMVEHLTLQHMLLQFMYQILFLKIIVQIMVEQYILATAEPIVIVDDCVFENNNAINNGGVVFANDDSPYPSIYDITFNNCDINGNSAKNGAVVYAEDNLVGTNVTIVSSNVINNTGRLLCYWLYG